MKVYKNKKSFIYRFFLMFLYILPIAIIIVYFVTGIFAFQSLIGLFTVGVVVGQMRAHQYFIRLNEKVLEIVNMRYEKEIKSFDIACIDDITLNKNFLNGYKIRVRCGLLIETNTVNLTYCDILNLKGDLESFGVKVTILG